MFCSNCGATLSPSPGFAPTRCFACGQYTAPAGATPAQAAQQAAAARFLEDRNHNGIPDVLEGPQGAAMLGNPYLAPAAPTRGLDHVPPAPRQPSARAREVVFAYQGSQQVKLVLGVVFLLVGTVMSTIFCWGLPADLALSLFGSTVTGAVTGTEIQTSVTVNHRHPQLTHYRFRLDGTEHTGSSSALSYTPGQPRAGTPIPIEVLAAMPSFSRAAGTTSSFFGYGVVFVLLFPMIGGLFTVTTVRENRREIRAFIQGTPALAAVTFQGPDTSTKMNGRHPYKIEWQLPVGPSVYKGRISSMNRSAIAELAAGGQIIVLYDPQNPRINTVYVA